MPHLGYILFDASDTLLSRPEDRKYSITDDHLDQYFKKVAPQMEYSKSSLDLNSHASELCVLVLGLFLELYVFWAGFWAVGKRIKYRYSF
jgi:hypothetical protein